MNWGPAIGRVGQGAINDQRIRTRARLHECRLVCRLRFVRRARRGRLVNSPDSRRSRLDAYKVETNLDD